MIKTVKNKPVGWVPWMKHSWGTVSDNLLQQDMGTFLEKYQIPVKLQEKVIPRWVNAYGDVRPEHSVFRLLVKTEDLELVKMLSKSVQYIDFTIATCKARGGNPRTREECIAFCGTSGTVPNIFREFNRPAPAVA